MRRMSVPLAGAALMAAGLTFVALSALQRHCDTVPANHQLHVMDDGSHDVMDVTSAVYGTASLQGVHGFSADVLTCSSVYRFQWFVVLFELFSLLGLLACAGESFYRQMRMGFLGVFAVLALLYIQMTDSFLTASNVAFYREEPRAQRVLQAMIAGCMATSGLNVLLVLTLGMRCGGYGAGWRHHAAATQHAAAAAAALHSKINSV